MRLFFALWPPAPVADTPPGDATRTGVTGISVQVGLVVAGLALLVLGADWLVAASVVFAQRLGVSDLVIGLTLVAGGTSLPEVATSITAALRTTGFIRSSR